MLRLFRVRPDEAPFVAWVALLAFVLAFGRVLLLSVGNALFLASHGPESYGWVYLLGGLLLGAMGWVYRRAIPRLRFDHLASGALACLGAVLLVLAAGAGQLWLRPALPAFLLVVWVFGILILWGLASRGVDEEQARRLFGLMGVGEVLGDVVGGLSVGGLFTRGGALFVLGLSALSLFGAAVLVRAIAARYPEVRAEEAPSESEPQAAAGLGPWRPYVTWVAMMGGLVTLCWYLVDASLYRQLATRYSSPAEVSAFVGTLWAVIATSTGLVRLFVSGPALRRLGASGIMLLPLAMLAILAGVAASASLGTAESTFASVALSMFAWRVLRDGIDKPGALLLYQAMPPGPRLAAQSLVETAGDAGATCLAGVLLLVLQAAPDFGAGGLALITGALVVAWAAVVRRLLRLHRGLSPAPCRATSPGG